MSWKFFVRVISHTIKSDNPENEYDRTVNDVFTESALLPDNSFLIKYDYARDLGIELKKLSEYAVNKIYYLVSVVFEKKEKKAVKRTNILCDSLKRETFENGEKSKIRLRITNDVYDKLPIEYQALFSTKKTIKGMPVRDGLYFYKDAKTCFVISPIGEKKSSIRKRADKVFEEYIKPACEGADFKAMRGDNMINENIMKGVLSELKTAPRVIAYLGFIKKGWNPNVMFEIGFRMATVLPIIILIEPGQMGYLPFDLRGNTTIEIGGNERDTVNNLMRMLKAKNESIWKYTYPYARINIDIDKNEHTFLESSKSFIEFIDAKEIADIKGSPIALIINNLKKMMPRNQGERFEVEQKNLLKELLAKEVFEEESYCLATYPIVFEKHSNQQYKGRMFLPMIVKHAKFLRMNKIELEIIYMEVTKIAKKQDDETYKCEMVGLSAVM